MTKLATLALHHRDNFSQGNSRRVFGYEAYHWSIIIMPDTSRERDWYVFDATDRSEIDPITFRMNNPTMDWWFRAKSTMDPAVSAKFLGCIVIGQVPDGASFDEFESFFSNVPLPVKNTHPQQSCVTWAVDAIRALQGQGWAQAFELGQFKDWALAYADERMKGSDSTEPKLRYYDVQG